VIDIGPTEPSRDVITLASTACMPWARTQPPLGWVLLASEATAAVQLQLTHSACENARMTPTVVGQRAKLTPGRRGLAEPGLPRTEYARLLL
jgi:hypothetical protein